MEKTKNLVFTGLQIVAWIIFVGLCIQAGAFVVNFIFSIYKPESLPLLYQKLDLTALYIDHRPTFFCIYSFILSIAAMKACLFYVVITLLHKMDLSRPFNSFVARQISWISYLTLMIGLLSYLADQFTGQLVHQEIITGSVQQFWTDSSAFILMGAVIYIIAKIFKKGVAIQMENDLTI